MTCNYKVAALAVGIITIIFASLNLFKLVRHTDEDVNRFLCQHPKHDAHKDMLRRKAAQHHHKDERVKSHTIEKESISFEDKIRSEEDELIEKMSYDEKIKKEELCRSQISPTQIKGFRILNKIGIALSIVSIIASLLIFAATSSDHQKNKRNRYFLLPYIVAHLGVISYELFAGVFAFQLAHHKMVVMLILILITSVIAMIIFITLVAFYYRLLSAQGASSDNGGAKEAFDYSNLVEEKNASEA